MVAPITQELQADPGGLLALWDEVVLSELPFLVRTYVRSQSSVTPIEVLTSMLDAPAVADACADFIETARDFMTAEFDSRSAEISLRRAGLLTEDVPTLEEIGRQFGLTRQRVSQLQKCAEGVLSITGQVDANVSRLQREIRLRSKVNIRAKRVGQRFAELMRRHPLAHTMRAWFDVNRGRPLTDSDLNALLPGEQQRRCCRRVLEVLNYPHISWDENLWFRNETERGACQAIIGAADAWIGAKDWFQVAQQIRTRVPGIEHILDIEGTVRRLGESHNCGLGPDGRIVANRSQLVRRMGRKIVTYLIARASPVSVHELAAVISAGQAPFEVFLRPSVVGASWLEECIAANDLLIQRKDKRIALAPSVAARTPTGTAGILYSIVSRHGEPIRMQDLCDKAGAFGLSRNQTYTLVHSRRAACLFMLSRGVVGLVGRDEAADPAEYETASHERKRVRPGHEIGWEEDGSLAADIQVRRSIREQGLGLPWPFSLALFSGTYHLFIDGVRVVLARKPNGDLDLPQLVPGEIVRIALRLRPRGPILAINTKLRSQLNAIRVTGHGSFFPEGLPARQGRPGWMAEFEKRHDGKLFKSLEAVSLALPAALSERRRLYALHALLPLGIVRHTSLGWRVAGGQSLPRACGNYSSNLRAD